MADETDVDNKDRGGDTLWQIKCGATDRARYGWVFKRYGIIQLGWAGYPIAKGYLGNEEEYKKYKAENKVEENLYPLNRFANEAKINDYVLLVYGSEVLGAGKITGGYEFDNNRIFDDMDEWGLPHYRRVEWLNVGEEEFAPLPKKIEGRFSKVNQNFDAYMKRIKEIEKSHGYNEKYEKLPIPEKLSNEELMKILGKLNKNYDEFSKIKENIIALYNALDKIAEAETSTYLVLPLLKALGWDNNLEVRLEQTKDKKRRDITLYKNDKISAIIEVKKARSSLFSASQQIFGYCKAEECKTAIITDGRRYAIFKTDKGFTGSEVSSDDIKLNAYLDLMHTDRRRHPLYLSDQGIESALNELSRKK